MRVVLAVLFLVALTEFEGKAQDLTGQWTGTSTDSRSQIREKIVLNIAAGDSLLNGVLHWYSPETQDLRDFIVRGWFRSKDSSVSIRQEKIIREASRAQRTAAGENPYTRDSLGNSDNGKAPHILYYRMRGHKDVLEGHWTIRNGEEGPGHPSGQTHTLDIRLEKKAPPFIPFPPTPYKKKDSTHTARPSDPMLARQTPLILAIPVPVRLDSVLIELYDNGEIDGDSVSLYLNDRLIISHLMLLEQPKRIWIPFDKSLPVNKLVLCAENLGRLPPNTALMEVTVNGRKYPIFLSTDYKRNAMVEFILQE